MPALQHASLDPPSSNEQQAAATAAEPNTVNSRSFTQLGPADSERRIKRIRGGRSSPPESELSFRDKSFDARAGSDKEPRESDPYSILPEKRFVAKNRDEAVVPGALRRLPIDFKEVNDPYEE